MKKLYFLAVIALISTAAMAQKTMPVIKVGTAISADLDYSGQALQLELAVKTMGDPTNFSWDAAGAGGTYSVKAKGFETGTKFYAGQPQPDGVNNLGDDETFVTISKAAYQAMIKNKTFTYSGLTYITKNNGDFQIGGKPVDATFVTTPDEKTSMWILNNPDFPLTLSMKGNPAGINYTVTNIK